MSKQMRNYLELNYDHDENCVIDCSEHDWWCIIHIRDHNGCDCDLNGHHLLKTEKPQLGPLK